MIPYGRHYVDDDDVSAVVAVLRAGNLTQGPKIGEFERAVADYVGARYAVAVSSGTAALHLACLAADLGPGERLLTSPITFVASANCALYAGATAAFADVDATSGNLSPAALAAECLRLGPVKTVVPVHYAGLPCDIEAISEVARRHGAAVIEDASHALGARYADGSPVGNCRHSEMTVFSFHPVKLIAAGEGGMVTTNDGQLYRRLLRLRSHGINKDDDPYTFPENAHTDGLPNPWYYEMQELGFNYRITDIQAALALSQMRKLDRFLARRRELAHRYDAALAGLGARCRPLQPAARERNAHHLYVVRIPFGKGCPSRARIMTELRARGIITQVHYVPVPMHPVYRAQGFDMDSLPGARQHYAECLSLPLYFGLSDAEQDFVVASLQSALA